MQKPILVSRLFDFVICVKNCQHEVVPYIIAFDNHPFENVKARKYKRPTRQTLTTNDVVKLRRRETKLCNFHLGSLHI